mmetsp:Transcript_27095/g.73005  ORF Transcript_27095/g.73005 Transcript_27095/m.73005 type:complete len:204 (-) Transcript_27095:495-1106(-)
MYDPALSSFEPSSLAKESCPNELPRLGANSGSEPVGGSWAWGLGGDKGWSLASVLAHPISPSSSSAGGSFGSLFSSFGSPFGSIGSKFGSAGSTGSCPGILPYQASAFALNSGSSDASRSASALRSTSSCESCSGVISFSMAAFTSATTEPLRLPGSAPFSPSTGPRSIVTFTLTSPRTMPSMASARPRFPLSFPITGSSGMP